MPERRRTDVLGPFPVPAGLVPRCSFSELGGEEIEVVRTSLGVDRKEVGLGLASVVEGNAGGHVDKEKRSGCQCRERDGAIGGFRFRYLGARDGVEFGEGVAAGDEPFRYPVG
jgi:hypothetical protein